MGHSTSSLYVQGTFDHHIGKKVRLCSMGSYVRSFTCSARLSRLCGNETLSKQA